MPVDIVCEIFEAAARADPDAPFLLTMTCEAWKRLVIETPRLWSDIRIDVDDDDELKALHLSLLLSKNWPLDIAIIGVCASDEIVNGLTLMCIVSGYLSYPSFERHECHFAFLGVHYRMV